MFVLDNVFVLFVFVFYDDIIKNFKFSLSRLGTVKLSTKIIRNEF